MKKGNLFLAVVYILYSIQWIHITEQLPLNRKCFITKIICDDPVCCCYRHMLSMWILISSVVLVLFWILSAYFCLWHIDILDFGNGSSPSVYSIHKHTILFKNPLIYVASSPIPKIFASPSCMDLVRFGICERVYLSRSVKIIIFLFLFLIFSPAKSRLLKLRVYTTNLWWLWLRVVHNCNMLCLFSNWMSFSVQMILTIVVWFTFSAFQMLHARLYFVNI